LAFSHDDDNKEKARSATPRRRKALGEYYLFPLHVLYDTSHFRLLRIRQEGKGHLKSQKTFKRLTFWYDDVSLSTKTSDQLRNSIIVIFAVSWI
jgi:hypothetical protein